MYQGTFCARHVFTWGYFVLGHIVPGAYCHHDRFSTRAHCNIVTLSPWEGCLLGQIVYWGTLSLVTGCHGAYYLLRHIVYWGTLSIKADCLLGHIVYWGHIVCWGILSTAGYCLLWHTVYTLQGLTFYWGILFTSAYCLLGHIVY